MENIFDNSKSLLRNMIDILIIASEKILEIYNGTYDVRLKDDASPLTTADIASNAIITKRLRDVYPQCDILSEEDEDSATRLDNKNGVFILDPLDGTKEFINRNGEFCVSLGFALDNRIVAGVITVPTQGLVYYAAEGMGSFKTTFDKARDLSLSEQIHVSDRTDSVIVAVSRSHFDSQTAKILQKNQHRIIDTVAVGSCLKGCYIAEGLADVHYRYGDGTKEWDTAAMEIICREAGASFTDLEGRPLLANRKDPVNRRGFLILNHPLSALDTHGIE